MLNVKCRSLTFEKALLIIFAKEPTAGHVKTRLSPPLSLVEAAELYHYFLTDVVAAMTGLRGIEVAIAYDPATARNFFENLAPQGIRLVPQGDAGLGERLMQAFAWGFAQGFPAVMIRNSDSPDLPQAVIGEGGEALLAGLADVVLGPCPDGGYYLIGLRRPCPELFAHILWSTDAVLEQTLTSAAKANLQVHLLVSWPDIDNIRDVRNFLNKPLAPPAEGWRSHVWGRRHLLPRLTTGLGEES
jgi:rSAM/selenodomain-associated transferase 1